MVALARSLTTELHILLVELSRSVGLPYLAPAADAAEAAEAASTATIAAEATEAAITASKFAVTAVKPLTTSSSSHFLGRRQRRCDF